MKILQIIQRPQLRGAEIFACQLSEALIAKGHTVDVLFLFEQGTLNYNIPFLHLNANEKKRFWDFLAYKKLATIISIGKYDIVQANAGDTLKYLVIAKMLFNVKASIIFRNANKLSDFLTHPIQKFFNRVLVNQLDCVISVSELCKQDFIKTFHFPMNRIHYIPIGVSCLKQANYNSFASLGIEMPPNSSVILHVGSFVPEKNHEELINIFSHFSNKYQNAILLLVGEGKTKEAIEQLVLDKNLSQKVQFLGARKDVKQIMLLANVFVLPSLIEGLPAVILEAMEAKLPVIAYNVGGIGEVVINEKTGYLVSPNQTYAFIEILEKVINKKDPEIIDNAYQLITDKFDNLVIATEFEKQYLKLLS